MSDAKKPVAKGKSAADLLAAATGSSGGAAAASKPAAASAAPSKSEADLKGMSLRSGVHESVKALSELLHLCKVSEAEWSGAHENKLHVILCRKGNAEVANRLYTATKVAYEYVKTLDLSKAPLHSPAKTATKTLRTQAHRAVMVLGLLFIACDVSEEYWNNAHEQALHQLLCKKDSEQLLKDFEKACASALDALK